MTVVAGGKIKLLERKIEDREGKSKAASTTLPIMLSMQRISARCVRPTRVSSIAAGTATPRRHCAATSTGGSGHLESPHAAGPDGIDIERDKFGHPRLPHRGHFEEDKSNARREWCSKFTGTTLDYIGDWWPVDGKRDDNASTQLPTTLLKGNIENPIGMLTIPLSSTGPLLVSGEHINGSVLVPYATTEPGVSASATRGSRLISQSGGAVCRVTNYCQRRAPVFSTNSMVEAQRLAKWLEQQVPRIREALREVSEHGRLLKLQSYTLGRDLHVNFFYSTGDAAGQNMVTSLTSSAMTWIITTARKELKDKVTIKQQMIETGMSGDKRNSYMNQIIGRGIAVHAEVFVPESVVQSVFKLSSGRMQRCYEVCSQGILLSGAPAVNIATSDSLAAIYAATGQDVACIPEHSCGNSLSLRLASAEEIQLARKRIKLDDEQSGDQKGRPGQQHTVEDGEGGLYASMSIPNLSIGTVGGGTMLPTQKECLSMIGCSGSGGVLRFAEIIAASTLALDLSALASLASGRRMYSLEGEAPEMAALRKAAD
ncbi:3-hydroxy-3-methylglutaryl-coenzyme A reductase 1-like [Sycon ciliatum]|uniref:3-hydroxy-3-methylglutaryl-coenzyme A reductase 1-like n=1 Tax=Sycon ciliatum TaxID=27933 RepID=UPI0031F647AE